MHMEPVTFFDDYFPLLTAGKSPYPWQRALFGQMIRGDVPDSLGLPTGAGKTSIIPIWVLALAWVSIAKNDVKLPRRLVWVVNRRVVVDQATDEARKVLAVVLALPEDDVLRTALRGLSGTDCPLAIGTLRGERPDTREWSRHPAVPAIVIGTVDMIGSRLLFRGYGDSRYRRPYHAALLGVDALIINDEAHLTSAFAHLLLAIRESRPAEKTPFCFQIMLVSATERGLGAHPFSHSLEDDVAASPHFRNVYEAEKRLWLQPSADTQSAERKLVSLASGDPALRTLVFVESPEKALEAARAIEKVVGNDRVALLTGTMRGMERDQLSESPVFHAFQDRDPPPEPLFLVATSAAEVGVDITSERLVTMVVPADHLFQRFGRLNRFGDRDGEPHRIGEAHVVFVEPKDKEAGTPRANTLTYLRDYPVRAEGWRDISCRALREHPAPPEAQEPEPEIAPLHTWHLDLWAQTSIQSKAIPKVEAWLHGKEREVPETSVAWRAEAPLLAGGSVDAEELRQAIESYPILSRERLREPTSRVVEKLGEIAQALPDALCLFVSRDGEVQAGRLAGLLVDTDLSYGLVILPPGCGGLDRGILTTRTTAAAKYDVAERDGEAERPRYSVKPVGDGWEWTRIGREASAELQFDPRRKTLLRQFANDNLLGTPTVIEIPKVEIEDAEPSFVVLFGARVANRPARRGVELDDHTIAAIRHAEALAVRLFPGAESGWFKEAARLHDQGKRHELWQRAMGGDLQKPKAKTVTAHNARLLAGFRHELCSLMGAHDELACDAVLHLVGSHHGWGRPHWEARAYDPDRPEASKTAALAAARRFGELQNEYGHWGLAYLEAVFRAIDAMASEEGDNG